MPRKLTIILGGTALLALGLFLGIAFQMWSGAGEPQGGPGPMAGRHGGMQGGSHAGSQGPDHGPESRPASPELPVEAAPALLTAIRERVGGSGILEPEREVTLLARVEGEVEELLAEEGDEIEGGAELCAIDQEALRIAETIARIERDQTEVEHERMLELLDQQAASFKEVDDARYARQISAAAYEEALLRLSYSRPAAPFGGVVVKRFIEKGQSVRAGDQLFLLADFEPLLLRLSLPEKEVADVRIGQRVELRADRDSPPLALGRVERISPVIDRDTLTVEVLTSFPDAPEGLRPGAFAHVDIITRTIEDVVLVPRGAVLREKGAPRLFRILGDRVEEIEVQTGYEDSTVVQIREGIAPGDLVAVDGNRELHDHARVRIYREVPVRVDPLTVESRTE